MRKQLTFLSGRCGVSPLEGVAENAAGGWSEGKAFPSLITFQLLVRTKKDGFSDKYLSKILKVSEKAIRDRRGELGIKEAWLRVPVSGVENACYYYSTYNAKDTSTATTNPKKIMILGLILDNFIKNSPVDYFL